MDSTRQRDEGDGGGFDEPPRMGGRGEPSEGDDENASAEEFSAPNENDVFVEEAATAEAADAVRGIDPALLEAKRAIEDFLTQSGGQAARARSVETFQGSGNIVGVGIGLGLPDDDGIGAGGRAVQRAGAAGEPGTPTLNVYVVEPTAGEQVSSVLASAMGVRAAESGEVPVNVIVTGIIDAQPHRFRMRPAPCGISVGHHRITAGTIGALATGRSAPRSSRLLVLSNNHVLANSNSAVYGDCICQPGPADGGRCPADQIAILERFVPINFTGGTNYVDCATGWAWPDRVRREFVQLSGGAPTFFRISSVPMAPALGMLVGKSGRTTQLTSGRIIDISATINVNYAGRIATFRDQIAIRGTSALFSAGGDSGSAIWTWTAQRNPVGLLFAGGNGVTFANKIGRVLTALDIRLVT